MKEIVAIIPARMGSTRFSGKPMAKIHGVPMVGHVYFRTKMCSLLRETYVATCDQEIYDYINSVGGKAIMTSDSHERCSDRTAEAMLKVESAMGGKVEIVVMVQGDEPMVAPEMIEAAVNPMLGTTVEEFEDPNEVKVVVDLNNRALYFSREPIPSRRKGVMNVPMFKQVCIIPFRRDYLLEFNSLPETPLERIESVDMMRVIEHGEHVYMVITEAETLSVDTPEDHERVVDLMKEDALINEYKATAV
jgi:3-deoxy-manno-octulosonate cytidylyltransferase (CMP-KDO synthetase)